jgi:hypothetical protein
MSDAVQIVIEVPVAGSPAWLDQRRPDSSIEQVRPAPPPPTIKTGVSFVMDYRSHFQRTSRDSASKHFSL